MAGANGRANGKREGGQRVGRGSGRALLQPGEEETVCIHLLRYNDNNAWDPYSTQLWMVTQHPDWTVVVTAI